jgi:acyl-CoA reductase-like NAD-dependent aldehyde dehydrogenase
MATVEVARQHDVDRAAEAARAAFPAWAATPPGERRALLNRAADLLQERSEQIAALVTEETGGTFGWGMFNCGLAAGMLREAAAQAYGLVGEVIPSDVPGLLAMGVRQPVGVVAGIAPWNAPVILGTRAIATPLAYGNTVILKASEQCPRTHGAIVAAVLDAGLPPGVAGCARGRRGADRAPGGAPDQLHRVDPGRADHRREGRRAPQARAARARRQGPDGRARRRGHRRGGGRRELRRLHA